MSEWQDISTAPKDTDILLAWREHRYVFGEPPFVWKMEVGWAGMSNRCPPESGASNGWLHGQATHWMPLPPPPENTP